MEEEVMPANSEPVERIVAVIERSRPAAIAGWPAFWARLSELREDEAAAALETLAARGIVRRQVLNEGVLYIADPPHAGGRATLAGEGPGMRG